MRIVGGSLGGRVYKAKIGKHTRPTSERVREALSSVLDARGLIDDARILELFAGTGALSFELLSRGAASAVLVEKDRQMLASIRGATEAFGLRQQVVTLGLDLLGPQAKVVERLSSALSTPASLVIADPPYAIAPQLPELLIGLLRAGVVSPEAVFVVEHATREPIALSSPLAELASYRYGDTEVRLLAVEDP